MVEGMREIRFYWFFILLLISTLTLGSSPCFCETGGVYDKNCYDQSHEFSYRWSNGRAQLTPHWTPDDAQMVFGHKGRIFVVDSDGSELKSLSDSFEPLHAYSKTADIDFSPTLSPDGAKVAFTTLRYAKGELYQHTYEIATQEIDGSDRRRLTDNSWDDVSPAWSSDGSHIAFVSYREEGPRIYTMAPDGSEQRSIAPSVPAKTDTPVWSPNGSNLAFVGIESQEASVEWLDTYYSDESKRETRTSNQPIYREAVYVANPDGSSVTKLAWGNAMDDSVRTRIGVNDLIAPEEEVTHFSWSPDGRLIAFAARYYREYDAIYVADLETFQMRQILDISTVLEHQAYSTVVGKSLHGIAWSADGSQIMLEVGGAAKHDRAQYAVGGVYSVSADGSEPAQSLAAKYERSDSYFEWPAIVMRGRPLPFRLHAPLFNYLPLMDFLIEPGPTRIVRYTKPIGLNPWPEVEGLVLAAIAWDGSSETPLVKIEDNRLVAANQ